MSDQGPIAHETRYQIILFLWFLLPLIAPAQSLTAEATAEGVLLKEGTDRVLFYQQTTKSQDSAYSRANYIHPLYGLDGAVLTEDFPDDHPHHRGIFWAWHQILIGGQSVGDSWAGEDIAWDVQTTDHQINRDSSLTLTTQTFWKSPQWLNTNGEPKPFVSENTKIIAHPKSENYRVVDVEISLLALVPDLSIGGSDDEKGYGGFSVRMKMPEAIQFTSAEGEITPTTNALSAGPWMNVSGSLSADGTLAGIVIMDHPDNPGFPQPWILRAKSSMQNVVYPGRTPVPMSNQKPTVLRYRLVVHQGGLTEKKIHQLYENQSPHPTVRSILLEQLRNSHTNPNWYVPLRNALAGLTAEQAHWTDSTENHSICQLASHLLFWNQRMLIAFQGSIPSDFDDNNEETFAEYCTSNWPGTVEKLDSIQTIWEQAVAGAPEEQLKKWGTEIANVGSHNAYHTGQIVYIRKRNGWWSASRGVK